MSKEGAEKFFDKLEKDQTLRITVGQELETIVKKAGFDATEAELTAELAKRWAAQNIRIPYSEPPGF
jgi:Nif11 domain